MPKTKKKSVCIRKCMPVLNNNDDSDSDTVDDLETAEQPESGYVLLQETVKKKKRRAKKVMSADTEDVLIEWIRDTLACTRRV